MASRFQREDPFEVEDGELNLTPYLDIITTLVIFMIFTFQVVVEFRLVDVFSPAYTAVPPDASSAGDTKMKVSIMMNKDGHLLVASNGGGVALIEKKAGAYDVAALRKTLIEWKDALSLDESVMLTAEANVPYKDVVATMDAIRRDEKRWLFPDVVFGKAVVGTP